MTSTEPRTKHAGGRPPVIDRTLADGRTVAQTVLDAVSRGRWLETGAAEAGITPEAAREWLRVAARLHLANTDPAEHTAYQRACVEFSAAHAKAQSEYEAHGLGEIDQAARGERKITKVKEVRRFANKDDTTGWLFERATEVATVPPDWRAQVWRLAHLMPGRYSQVVKIVEEVGLSEDDKADAVADSLEGYLQGVADAEAARAAEQATP